MADQLTPRVVRTVEELAALDPDTPILTAVNTCHLAGALLAKFRGMGHVTSAMFPATVLAPLSVTAEQVEAGARAFMAPRMHTNDKKNNVRTNLTAALAAMGIPVVESWLRCPHVHILGIYGDRINYTPKGRRLLCLDCGRHLDGPVTLATHHG